MRKLLTLLACLPTLASAAPEAWREPLTGMNFIKMTGGCYQMGDTFGKGESNELPVHEICLRSYWVGQYEVTQGEWNKAVAFNPSAFSASAQHPVDSVNQTDITNFIEKLGNANPGRKFRLPTEAEWEYACRAAGLQTMYGGQQPPTGGNTAEYADQHGESTLPVGSFSANALGLHDMSGNLWEWVSDVYAADAYLQHPRNNPQYNASGPSRLLRGGGWSHPAGFARCSKRHMHCRPSARFDFVGFRLVLEAE